MRILQRKDPNEPSPRQPWNLNAPLFYLSEKRGDPWTINDAFEHTAIFGGTGSGKSSGSARALASSFLASGFGGLVLCAKPDEASRWASYCAAYGRSRSFVRFDASGRYRFNFLDYVMKLPPEHGGGLVDNAVNVLLHVIEAGQARETRSSGGGNGADFWQKSLRQILANSIASLYHAYGRVRLR